MSHKTALAILIAAASMVLSLPATSQPATFQPVGVATSPVRTSHLDQIRSLFARYGIPRAQVTMDRFGRVSLAGDYEDREEVEIAHSIVQSVVGLEWTSFVTPGNIRVTNLQKGARSALNELFAKVKPAGSTPPPAPAAGAAAPQGAAPGPIRHRYAMVIGVGKFAQRGINPLEFSTNDAQVFHDFLTDPGGGKFQRQEAELLLDQNAQSQTVLNWLDRVERMAEPDDLVIFYASTHGSAPDSEGAMAVVTHDTEVDRPALIKLRKTSVPGSRLSSFFQNVKAKRVIIVLDTCYSSAAFTHVPGYAQQGAGALSGQNEVYSVHREAAVRMVGGKDLISDDDLPLAPQAPGAKAEGWGRVLITASGPDQRSWESRNLKGSFFTHYFVRGLRNTGNMRDAYAYSRQVVPGEVQLEKKATQTPKFFSTNANWAVGF